jgi:hypothetical protein
LLLSLLLFVSVQRNIDTNTQSFESDKAMPIKTRRAAKDMSMSE